MVSGASDDVYGFCPETSERSHYQRSVLAFDQHIAWASTRPPLDQHRHRLTAFEVRAPDDHLRIAAQSIRNITSTRNATTARTATEIQTTIMPLPAEGLRGL
jgi:hypothetical protein